MQKMKRFLKGFEKIPNFRPKFQSTKIKHHTCVQYCAKVMQMNFNEIPGFSWLFEEISLETIFQRNFPAFS